MTARKGGIGRRPGRKGKCSQKKITKTSATLASKKTAQEYKENIDFLSKSTVNVCFTLPTIDQCTHRAREAEENKEMQYNEIISLQKLSIRSLNRSLKGANNRIKDLKVQNESAIKQSHHAKNCNQSQLKEIKEASDIKVRVLKSNLKVANLNHDKEIRNMRSIMQTKSRSSDLRLKFVQSQSQSKINKALVAFKTIEEKYCTKEKHYKNTIKKLQVDPRKLRVDKNNMKQIIEKERIMRSKVELKLERDVDLKRRALKRSCHAETAAAKSNDKAQKRYYKAIIVTNKASELKNQLDESKKEICHLKMTSVAEKDILPLKEFKKIRNPTTCGKKGGGSNEWP